MRKVISISIPEELNERWNAVAKKLKVTKSSMIDEYLEQILPILEQKNENKMLRMAMKEMAKSIDATANLFDTPVYNERAEFDKSVEDYKKEKLG